MSTTIQQVAGETSSGPINGRPFNFNGLLDKYEIPRSVAADPKLLPGARLLWGVLRQYSWRDGRCTLSDETLARAVGVQWRQLVRYCRQLENAGLLLTTARPGKTPVRELLWDPRFAGKVRKPPVLEDSTVCLTGQPPLSSKTGTLRKRSSLRSSVDSQSANGLEKPSPKPAAPPVPKPAAEWSEEDYIARGRACGFPEHMIEREIERMRERKARPQQGRMVKDVELEPELAAAIRR